MFYKIRTRVCPVSAQSNDEQRGLGTTEAQIKKMSKFVRKNCKMTNDASKGGIGILWATDDPELHSFELTPRGPRRNREHQDQEESKAEETNPPTEPPVVHTVASYFQARYGIRLLYPCVSSIIALACLFAVLGGDYLDPFPDAFQTTE